MAEQKIRTFLAIDLAVSLKEELRPVLTALKNQNKEFRFIPPENWHLTLHFFGSISEGDVLRIKMSLKTFLFRLPSFSIHLESLNAFPSRIRAEVVWVGVSGDSNTLSGLKQQLDEWLKAEKFPVENRAFRPHITVARARRKTPFQSLGHEHFKGREIQKVTQLTLYQSRLSKGGSQYTPLFHIPLISADS